MFIAKQFSKDLNLKHSHVEVTEDNFVNAIENIVNCLEIPICNQNLPAYYLTAKFLSDNGKTITFSGDGGDETFSGYPRHIIWLQCLILLKNDVERLNKLIEKKFGLQDFDIKDYNQNDKFYIILYFVFSFGSLEKYYSLKKINDFSFFEKINYLKKSLPNFEILPDVLDSVLYCERFLQLSQDFLLRGDKIGMAFSMEARFPILSNKIQKYCSNISINEKIVSGRMKEIIRRSYEKILPLYILNKKKTGWSAPTENWFNKKGKLNHFIMDNLNSQRAKSINEVFNFKNWIKEPNITLVGNNKKQFYAVLYLVLWIKKFNVVL